ncbi:MAG: serine/threonine protein kinase [Candidatus Obscuribacterales bacterium]|nr:serine/threonine protein kinase [Candidatus Obscuribacterales bacterium]
MDQKQDEKQNERSSIRIETYGLPERFEIKGLIAEGGMGAVLHARELLLDREVAIKILKMQREEDKTTLARFAREAKLLASLRHPNIVRFLSWDVTESGTSFQVLEYLEGQPLSKELEQSKRLSASRFYSIFSQVLAGLSESHENGIIHRDIKPSNIMLCPTSSGICPKLIDFGIARTQNPAGESQDITRTRAVLGSPSYMSPEQCKAAELTQATDIYSLGCVMYEAIKGSPPHQGETAMEIMYKQISNEPDPLSAAASDESSRRLATLIEKCLNKNPEERPSASSLKEELDRIFQEKNLDSSSFFANAVNTEKQRTLMPSMLLIPAVLLILIFALLTVQKKAGSPEIESNHSAERAINYQKRLLKRAKIAYEASHGANTRDAWLYMEGLLGLAALQYQAKKFSDAESSFALAEKIGPEIDRLRKNSDAKAYIGRYEAEYKINRNQISEAMKQIDDALQSKVDDSNFIADLARLKVILLLRQSDLKNVQKPLQKMFQYGFVHNATEREVLNRPGFSLESKGVENARFVSRKLQALTLRNKVDKLYALEIYNQLAKYLTQESAPLRATEAPLLDLAKDPQLKAETKILKESYKNLAANAELCGEPDKARAYLEKEKSISN